MEKPEGDRFLKSSQSLSATLSSFVIKPCSRNFVIAACFSSGSFDKRRPRLFQGSSSSTSVISFVSDCDASLSGSRNCSSVNRAACVGFAISLLTALNSCRKSFNHWPGSEIFSVGVNRPLLSLEFKNSWSAVSCGKFGGNCVVEVVAFSSRLSQAKRRRFAIDPTSPLCPILANWLIRRLRKENRRNR